MSRALAIVVGHGSKAPRTWDPGAVYDLDQDGEVEQGETEAAMIRAVAWSVLAYLTGEGVPCVVLDVGSYAERAERVAAFARDHEKGVALYLHANAGLPPGETRALVAHLARSRGGQLAAEHLAEQFSAFGPGDDACQVVAIGDREEGWRERARYVLAPSWSLPTGWSGVLAEPFHVAGMRGIGGIERLAYLDATIEAICTFATEEDDEAHPPNP